VVGGGGIKHPHHHLEKDKSRVLEKKSADLVFKLSVSVLTTLNYRKGNQRVQISRCLRESFTKITSERISKEREKGGR